MTSIYIRRRLFVKLRLYNDHLSYFNQKVLNGFGACLILYGLSVTLFMMEKFQLLKKTEIVPSTTTMAFFTMIASFMVFRIWNIRRYGLNLPKSDEILDEKIPMAVKIMNLRYRRQVRVVRSFSRIQVNWFVIVLSGAVLTQIYESIRNEFHFDIETVLVLVVTVAVILGNLTRLRIANRTFDDVQHEPHIKIRNIVVNFLIQSRLNPRNK